jgi:hypothetical protein
MVLNSAAGGTIHFATTIHSKLSTLHSKAFASSRGKKLYPSSMLSPLLFVKSLVAMELV